MWWAWFILSLVVNLITMVGITIPPMSAGEGVLYGLICAIGSLIMWKQEQKKAHAILPYRHRSR